MELGQGFPLDRQIREQLAMGEVQQTGTGAANKFKIVSDHKDDLAHLRQFFHELGNLLHAVKIQSAGGFIKNQQFFLAKQAAGYGYPLLLTTGECIGVLLPVGG